MSRNLTSKLVPFTLLAAALVVLPAAEARADRGVASRPPAVVAHGGPGMMQPSHAVAPWQFGGAVAVQPNRAVSPWQFGGPARPLGWQHGTIDRHRENDRTWTGRGGRDMPGRDHRDVTYRPHCGQNYGAFQTFRFQPGFSITIVIR